MSNTNRGILSLLITMIGWSSAGIFIKLLPSMSASLIVSIRLTISLVIIGLFAFIFKKSNLSYLKELKDFRTWGLGIIIYCCYLFGTLAFQMAPVAEVTLFMTMSPIFIIIFKLFTKENISKNELYGISFSILGVVFITYNQLTLNTNIDINRIIGDLYAILIALLFALYTLIYKKLKNLNKAPNTFIISISTFFIGFISLLFLYSNNNNIFDVLDLKSNYLWYLLGISILSTTIPTISYTLASKYLSPISTASILLLQPFIAIALSAFFINEIPSLLFIPGLITILLGLFIMLKNQIK